MMLSVAQDGVLIDEYRIRNSLQAVMFYCYILSRRLGGEAEKSHVEILTRQAALLSFQPRATPLPPVGRIPKLNRARLGSRAPSVSFAPQEAIQIKAESYNTRQAASLSFSFAL
jgi:hypothetical protein